MLTVRTIMPLVKRQSHSEKPSAVITDPDERWPLAIKAVAKLRKNGERGVGDTVERLIATTGADITVHALFATVGKKCGCRSRRDWLNARYPYRTKAD